MPWDFCTVEVLVPPCSPQKSVPAKGEPCNYICTIATVEQNRDSKRSCLATHVSASAISRYSFSSFSRVVMDRRVN